MKKSVKASLALVLALGVAGCSNEAKAVENNEIQLFKMYDTEKGTYLLDPKAEYENVILVDKELAVEWEVYGIHHGTEVTGVFDEEGWELLDIKK